MASELGSQMYDLARRLYPICRSITGEGVRKTLKILQESIPLEIKEVPSGTEVFDWVVPLEWNIREAWIKDEKGEKVVDFANHNLHILNYSIPYRGKLSLKALKEHIFCLPEKPDLIPYRTSYYNRNWGFCMTYEQLQTLEEGTYEVFIDATLASGCLNYGELVIPGESDEEFLLSTHICHPSLANDNLSGMVLLTHLAQAVLSRKNYYSYRFLFIPGTIGSITWLALNQGVLPRIKGGLVASLVGDPAPFHFKKSRRGNSTLDQVVQYVLEHSNFPFEILDFHPYGYDERQFCSPGIDLAVGNLTRSIFGYPEYHTSADNLDFISARDLSISYEVYLSVIQHWDCNQTYLNLSPMGEPQLGKRGLYQAIGGQSDSHEQQMAMLWILNQSDGSHTLLDVARKSGIPLFTLQKVAGILQQKKLLQRIH
ncbi:MAG: DUF4910 domain-containing protein [Saprospiraceae bacterium]|nr:DUF4910 domain-containing protein [Saprospiraceae bacterium]